MEKTKQLLRKVPEVGALFWVIKILTTAMGESTSDFLVGHFNPEIAVACTGIVFAASLVLQFSMRKYVTWVYWFAVVMVSIFGTMAADILHVGLGIPYIVSASFFLIVLAIIFIVWYASEKTLSIHSIYTRKREVFYWAAVLATFALGTATGDMTATSLNLGYLPSGILFLILIILPLIGFWKFRLNAIFAFWFAYILTRPLGASFADWGAVPVARGGLNIGTGPISLTLTVLIVVLVACLAFAEKKKGAEQQVSGSQG
jgi:uncharacterized membrane-anchored protein